MIRKKTALLCLLIFFAACTQKKNELNKESNLVVTPNEPKKEVNPFDQNKKISEKDLNYAEAGLNKIFEDYLKSEIFIDVEQAKKMWGDEKYDQEAFLKGDEKTKASMVAGFVEQKIAIGKHLTEIEKYVGRRSGYFFNDQFFAVIFKKGSPKKADVPATKTYQLVFFTDDTDEIVEVRIHQQ